MSILFCNIFWNWKLTYEKCILSSWPVKRLKIYCQSSSKFQDELIRHPSWRSIFQWRVIPCHSQLNGSNAGEKLGNVRWNFISPGMIISIGACKNVTGCRNTCNRLSVRPSKDAGFHLIKCTQKCIYANWFVSLERPGNFRKNIALYFTWLCSKTLTYVKDGVTQRFVE